MSRRAAIYLRPLVDARAALAAWLRGEGFRPWPALPRGYPATPEEVRELLLRPPAGPDDWSVVVPEAFDHVFRFAFELAGRTPGLAALAVTDRWDGRACAKLYRDGRVLLKAGDDPDGELAWIVPRSEPEAFAEAGRALALPAAAAAALAGWGRQLAAGAPLDLDSLARAFGLPEPPPRFAERRPPGGAAAATPYEHLLFVHGTSPLVRNA